MRVCFSLNSRVENELDAKSRLWVQHIVHTRDHIMHATCPTSTVTTLLLNASTLLVLRTFCSFHLDYRGREGIWEIQGIPARFNRPSGISTCWNTFVIVENSPSSYLRLSLYLLIHHHFFPPHNRTMRAVEQTSGEDNPLRYQPDTF